MEEGISGIKEKIEKNSWKEMFNLKEKKRKEKRFSPKIQRKSGTLWED